MTELQYKLLDMLNWLDSFCRENGIRYYLLGGTMLGATRHSGFIPWDDDIDVGVPRTDYEKLKELLKQPKSDRYILETPEDGAKEFTYGYCKLYDTSTTLVERAKIPIKRGIYIDVFPLDGIGDTKKQAFSNFKGLKVLQNAFLLKNLAFKKDRKVYKNVIVAVARLIPNFLLSIKTISKKADVLSQKYSFDNSVWVANLFDAWVYKEIVPRSVFGEPTEIQFENLTVFGVENPDEYLTSIYGDWRKLPPEEKRVSHHDYVLCDLNKSYLEE